MEVRQPEIQMARSGGIPTSPRGKQSISATYTLRKADGKFDSARKEPGHHIMMICLDAWQMRVSVHEDVISEIFGFAHCFDRKGHRFEPSKHVDITSIRRKDPLNRFGITRHCQRQG
jgi:hypothetical protein